MVAQGEREGADQFVTVEPVEIFEASGPYLVDLPFFINHTRSSFDQMPGVHTHTRMGPPEGSKMVGERRMW